MKDTFYAIGISFLQNPGDGYFRVKPTDKDIDIKTPETAIGYVRACQCYGHSDICDPETGICKVSNIFSIKPWCLYNNIGGFVGICVFLSLLFNLLK